MKDLNDLTALADMASRPTGRRGTLVAVLLVVPVLLVLGLSWWFTRPGAPDRDQPITTPTLTRVAVPDYLTSSVPAERAFSAATAPALTPWSPIPPGGVLAPRLPPAAAVIDARSITVTDPPAGEPSVAELSTPEAAAAAWLARWCPFSTTEQFGTAENRARSAMTADGWAEFDPTVQERARSSWQRSVAAGESGRCSGPVVFVSREAPRTETHAVVIAAAYRVIEGASAAAYVERLDQTRVVVRGPDGLWRVDVATIGG